MNPAVSERDFDDTFGMASTLGASADHHRSLAPGAGEPTVTYRDRRGNSRRPQLVGAK
jgi:hypothetical protein